MMLSTEYRVAGETPLSAIVRLAARGASGELIAASDAVELHVYLLDGRVAWATTSTAQRAFVHHLVDAHGIPADAVREVIAECHRTRGRLGETLIGWGIATAAQVRDALGAQITEALAAAAAHPDAHTLFLPRRLSYARELTFDLSEFEPVRAVIDLGALAPAIVTSVLGAIPEALWVEVANETEVLARGIRTADTACGACGALRRTLGSSANDSLIVRGGAGAILGQRLPGRDAAVWCAAASGGKLGMVAALLASTVGVAAPGARSDRLGDAWQERAGERDAGALGVLGGAMHTTDDLVAAMVLGEAGDPHGVWRGPDDLDVHAAVARELTAALHACPVGCTTCAADRFGHAPIALRGQRGGTAYHGTLLPGRSSSVWLVLPAWIAQGLGWALLQGVSRQVAETMGAA